MAVPHSLHKKSSRLRQKPRFANTRTPGLCWVALSTFFPPAIRLPRQIRSTQHRQECRRHANKGLAEQMDTDGEPAYLCSSRARLCCYRIWRLRIHSQVDNRLLRAILIELAVACQTREGRG